METKNIEPARVAVRCRPLLSREIQDQRESIIKMGENFGEISIAHLESSKTFSFDHVFGPETSQSTIYNEIAFPLIDSVLRGYNGTIFAHGQTGAGKTYTMQGNSDSEESKGIIPRALEQIFNYIENTPEKQFLVHVSFLEIYNEQVYDLLNKDKKSPLQIREKPGFGVYVQELLSLPAESFIDAYQKLILGNQTRAIRLTQMVESSEAGPDGKTHIKRGKLNLVGLAGSERQTGGSVRFKEAMYLGISFNAFANVISALADPRPRHVPFRDSKLTRLLQDSLGGNTKTVMIANIGPADWNYEETISTLRFVSRVKSIMNKPIINEEWRDSQEEIEESKAQLNEFQGRKITMKEGDKDERQGLLADLARREEVQKVSNDKKMTKEETYQHQEDMEQLKEYG